MTDQVNPDRDAVTDDVKPDDPAEGFNGDPRRARRVEIFTSVALYVGGGALASLAAGAAMAGEDSPIADYLTWIIVAGLALFATATAFWIAAIRMKNNPHVQLAWAIADRDALATAGGEIDRQIAVAREKLAAARQDGTLPASANEVAATHAPAWVTERDGAPAEAPAAGQRRPSPRRRRTRVAA